MVLRKLDLAAHAGDVDDGGRVPRDVLAAFGEKPEEGCGYEEDGERVDAVDAGPALERLPFEEATADGFCVLALRRIGILEPRRHGPGLSSTVR